MPTPVMAADLLLNPKGLARAIEDEVSAGASAGLEGGTKASQNKVMKAMYEARWNAIKLGNQKEADSIKEMAKKREATIIGHAAKLKKVSQDIKASEDAGIEDSARKELVAKQRNLSKLISLEQRAIEDASDKMAKGQAHRLDLLDAGLKKSARSFEDKMEDGLSGFADNFEGAISQALSAENLDLGALVKGMGSAIKDNSDSFVSGGANLAKHGSKMGGGTGKMVGMLGKAAMSIGAFAGAIAGVAAIIAGFIAVLMAAYGQTKQFNKAILEGSSAVDHLSGEAVGSATALSEALGETRRSAMYLAYDFRTTTEEVLGLGTAMNQAGFTFKEQTKVFTHQVLAMKLALEASQAFGAGAGEVAEMMNMMTRDFAMGQHAIADAFGDIFGAAQMSGMGVKGFFTAVSEATSGMALYNFRLEDTLELMVGLEKILGEDMGKNVMGQLKGKYKDMGFQERYQKVIVAGSAGKKVISASATRQGEGLMKSLLESPDARKLMEERKMVGADGKLDLSKLKGVELGDLQNAFEKAGLGEAADKLSSLAALQRGAAAGATTGQRAGALGQLDQAGTLAFDMASAFAVLGDKGIGDMESTDRMAFEQTTGISGGMFEAYKDISNRVGARLEDQGQGTGKDGKVTMTDIATAIAEGDMLSDKDKAVLEAAQEAGMSEMEKIARSQLTETTSILQTLKTGVVMVLETIYEMFLSSGLFGNWFAKDVSPREARKTKEKAEEEAANFVGEKVVYEEGATEKEKRAAEEANAEKNAAAKKVLEDKAAYEGKMYEGSLAGKGRETTMAEMYSDAGVALPGKGNYARKGETATFDVTPESELTEEQIALLVTSGKDREKEAAEQKKATEDAAKRAKKVAYDIFEKGQLADFGLDTDAKAEDFDEAEKKWLARKGNEGQEIPELLNHLRKQAGFTKGAPLDDFIYRGNAQSGTIHPIDSMDSFFGAKPGGAIDKGMGGRGVVINNLTINESGNPQKTLSMIKQAITAANK